MPPTRTLESTTVTGRPSALDTLAGSAAEASESWRLRAGSLLDAIAAAPAADMRGLQVDAGAPNRLLLLGRQMATSVDAVGDFARALRNVDRIESGTGAVVVASTAAINRWLAAHARDNDPDIEAILARLPDGRRRSLEDFEQMSASERARWIEEFVGTSGDERHRAIAAVLVYMADSDIVQGNDRSVFGDRWWSFADAAVLLVIQDGWLWHEGVPIPADRPHLPDDPRTGPYRDAVWAWRRHNDAMERGLDGEAALVSWTGAEEAGVDFAEVAVLFAWQRDPTFIPPTAEEWDQITELAPGTHAFRLAVTNDTERELVLAIIDAVIAHGIEAIVQDPSTGMWLVPGVGWVSAGSMDLTGLLDRAGDAIAGVGGGWGDSFGLGAATNLAGGGIGLIASGVRGVGAAAERGTEIVATEMAQTLFHLAEAQFSPDELEELIIEAIADPALVPPDEMRDFFDRLLGTDRAADELSFSYYFPMFIERGILPPLPSHWTDADGTVHHEPPPVQGGPLSEGD